jgi:hypothetical protein
MACANEPHDTPREDAGAEVGQDAGDGIDALDIPWEDARVDDSSDAEDAQDPEDVQDAQDSEDTQDSEDAPDGEEPRTRALWWGPRAAPEGARVPLWVQVQEDGGLARGVSGWLDAPVGGAEGPRVLVRRGAGSTTWSAPAGSLELAGRPVGRELPRRRLEGSLSGSGLVWGPDEVIELPIGAQVPRGSSLTVHEGVWVLLGERANLDVSGSISVEGSQAAPVVFEALELGKPWGGVKHDGDGRWRWAFVLEAGADASRAFGHSRSQPALYAGPGARLDLERVAVQDCVGKGVSGREAQITMRGCMTARTDTGGEHEYVALTLEESHFMDFPTLDAPPADDDNDAIYLRGTLMLDGEPAMSRIADTTFIGGQDDGVDHNSATVELERVWIEGFAHEGVAASDGGAIWVRDSVVKGCEQGVEAGYGAPALVVERSLLWGNGVGARFGDSYQRTYEGSLTVLDTVFFENTDRCLWDFLLSTQAPGPEGAVSVSGSLCEDDTLPAGAGNARGSAVLDEGLRLAPDSPGRGIGTDGADPGLQTPTPR